ncbi:MAG TPA: pyridoxine 5'-phosphate synthase [Myxococcota bacterium]|nr:pyridoxine 5'-phosphate synthase [Myxococcota bacterium]
MRAFVLELDALPSLREAASASEVDLAAAATLAELAGVDAVRLGVNLDMKPVREEDLRDARRAARRLELRMPPLARLLEVSLALRPDRVLLAADGREGRAAASPLDLRGESSVAPMVRNLHEAGIAVGALVAPGVEAVKRAHAEGLTRVELYTGALTDLPAAERRAALTQLSDAARLAAKLGIEVGVAGGLGYRSLREVLEAAPAAERVAVGRAALARALLVGLDQALRDLRALAA